uniref:NADH-ubiquinone oxidoreductase chain 2 n=1 Tax=Hirsutella thompsonii TaxID=42368 RepID=A0A3G2ZNS4_HIRTH|nr:NADH dehydrogenase subunit 2 [Hirsutella thompsonii]AYP41264.1 NADH dehydrogenase subunit 2 [Hirsutella thompsonii]AYP41294.1 NADH dehydrogenase subunit 2 [Hirsutella thompsonii]
MIIISILALLLSNAVNLRRDISILYNRIAMIILVYCILNDLSSLTVVTKGLGLHGGLLLVTNITQIFHIFLFIISTLILTLTSFYPRKIWVSEVSSLKNLLFNVETIDRYKTKIINKMGQQFKIIEYPLLLLFVITGAIFLMSSNDFVSIFLAIELQSYGLYILSTVYRNSELSTTGGLIYFLLGGLSSCFILLGTGLLYANSGSTSLDSLYIITSISDMYSDGSEAVACSENLWYKPDYINFSLLIFTVGFLFKVSAAPFHFWSPDVYDAIPTIVTTFVALIAKISIFILLLQLVYYTNNNFLASGSEYEMKSWTFILLMSSLFSLIVGTVVGLTQYRIKRLFAYSTISHVGFILLALGISSIESTQAFIFYLTQYTISNLNAFFILIAIGFSLYCYTTENKEHEELMDKTNSPIQLVNQLKGYFYINPVLALSLAITIFSFVGVPPLIGFFGKQMVLSAALDKGLIFLSLIAILTSVIGAVYYLSIVKEMFFSLPEYKVNTLLEKLVFQDEVITRKYNTIKTKNIEYKYNNIAISSPISFVISCVTLQILLFLFINKEWLSMGTILVQTLFNS